MKLVGLCIVEWSLKLRVRFVSKLFHRNEKSTEHKNPQSTPLMCQYMKFKCVKLFLFLVIFSLLLLLFLKANQLSLIFYILIICLPETDLWEVCAKWQVGLREWGQVTQFSKFLKIDAERPNKNTRFLILTRQKYLGHWL